MATPVDVVDKCQGSESTRRHTHSIVNTDRSLVKKVGSFSQMSGSQKSDIKSIIIVLNECSFLETGFSIPWLSCKEVEDRDVMERNRQITKLNELERKKKVISLIYKSITVDKVNSQIGQVGQCVHMENILRNFFQDLHTLNITPVALLCFESCKCTELLNHNVLRD